MPAKLIVKPVGEPPFEQAIAYTLTIGRGAANTVCLKDNDVSRQHAIIRRHEEDEYQIVDLGSRNATFVGQRRVVTPIVLRDGDVIRVAHNTMTFVKMAGAEAENLLEATRAGSMSISLPPAFAAAVMACDLRGFSAISARLPEAELAQRLGAWFRDAGNLIHKTGGTIDKFIGDAVLAFWICEQLAQAENAG